MTLKLFGAAMIIVSCSGFGFYLAVSHKKEVIYLQKLLAIIEYMEWELEYRLTPLPQLCKNIGEKTKFYISSVFEKLANELSYQIAPDVSCCMQNVLASQKEIPSQTLYYLKLLGESLGEYNVDGQLKSLVQLRVLISQKLDALTENQTQRLRCYQTIGVCAGAALAILFV